MSDSDEDFDDAMLWETELEIALLTKCDYGTIRNITKMRPIPASLRSKVWKVDKLIGNLIRIKLRIKRYRFVWMHNNQLNRTKLINGKRFMICLSSKKFEKIAKVLLKNYIQMIKTCN